MRLPSCLAVPIKTEVKIVGMGQFIQHLIMRNIWNGFSVIPVTSGLI